jgi:hypothetical protein
MWTFEQLEERHFLSATALTLDDIQWVAISGATTEGQQLIDLLNEQWRTRTSGASDGTAATTTQYETNSLPNDPYLVYQWNLLNVGQVVNYEGVYDIFGVSGEDINVTSAWDEGITGAGVLVAVLDTGVQITHSDLDGNISVYSYNALTGGTSVTPPLDDSGAFHGTAVAGIIAAESNGEGTVGIAYGAEIMPILIGTDTQWVSNLGLAAALLGAGAPVDIYNNSWGPVGTEANPRQIDSADLFYDPLDPTDADLVALFETAATQGRDGLGNIYVFSSGNYAGPQFSPGFQSIGYYDSASSNFFVNSRYTIAVGMVDHDGSIFNSDGTLTLYSEMSPAVLVVAPSASGPFDVVANPDTGSGIWTTDLLGDDGLNMSPLPSGIEIDGDNFFDVDYTSVMGGTSSAAPEVSAVIALMLEANPNLSYRDVEEILVRSARQNSPVGEDQSDPDAQLDSFFEPFLVPFIGDSDLYYDRYYNAAYDDDSLFNPGLDAGQDQLDLSWAVNAISVFRDPISHLVDEDSNSEIEWQIAVDMTDPENPEYSVVPVFEDFYYNPVLDPTFTDSGDRISTAVPLMFTNGAGYTVSYGRYGAYGVEYGYGHGVIDAGLAVELAKQWETQDQYVAPELTYLVIAQPGSVPIAAAEVITVEIAGSDDILMRIPGGLGWNDGGFGDYFEEFFEEPDILEDGDTVSIDPTTGPFTDEDPPENDRGHPLTITGPSGTNAMSVEWVEVQLDISGGGNDLDQLRIVLVSPDGTESELTNYHPMREDVDEQFQELPETVGQGTYWVDPPGELDDGYGEDDTFSWIYSTNRDWGERSEGTWSIYFDNYSGSELSLDGVRVAFHGKPISAAGEDTYRVQGKVGLDAGYGDGSEGYEARDGEFEFSRYQPNLEPYAAAVTVVATDTASGQVVGKFVTGADGNYYFDLPEGQYEFTVLDPEARELLGDSEEAGPGGSHDWEDSADFQLPDYAGNLDIAGTWTVSSLDGCPYYRLPAYAQSWIVNVGPNTDPDFAPDPDDPDSIRYSFIEGVNFLLDPGELPANEVVFEGTVFADFDADGVKDPADAGVPDFLVYADLNHSGNREASEPFALSSPCDGTYSLTVETTTANTYTLRVEPVQGWECTYPGSPTAGYHAEFAEVGDTLTGLDFGFEPPSSSGESTGTIFGFVFSDENGDGVFQETTELGIPGARVFIDAGAMNGLYDVGEAYVLTDSQGAFRFADVAPGTVRMDVDVSLPSEVTSPAIGYRDITVAAGEIVSDVVFGVANMAIMDFGDLVGPGFLTTEAEDGPRHRAIQGFSLGATVDAELDAATIEQYEPDGTPFPPNPDLTGIGDDVANGDDEDGVHAADGVSDLVLRGGINTLSVSLNGVGGYLTAWIDLNDDGDFEDVVSGISEHVIVDIHRSTGTHQLQIVLPSTLSGGEDDKVAARFRWSGSSGLDYYGEALIGEVEDYLLTVEAPIFGDYDGSGYVDDADYDVWKANFNTTVAIAGSGADGNFDGKIDAADYTVWRDHLGEGTRPPLFVAPDGDDSNDGSIGSPFATIEKALSMLTPSGGQTIYVRGGTYNLSSKIDIDIAGVEGKPNKLWAYGDETPIFDFSGQATDSGNRGFELSDTADWWSFKGLTIQNAGDNGLYTEGSNGVFEEIVTRYNRDSGFQLHGSASDNLVVYCDSYENYDPQNYGENADGFAVKDPDIGPGNIFRQDRAWGNSDDGWDTYYAESNGVLIQDCWSFDNGIDIWGVGSEFAGDGTGYKLGKPGGAHVLVNVLAVDNAHNGIDVNENGTGVQVYNSTSYSNNRNWQFDTDTVTHTLKNNISYGGSSSDNFDSAVSSFNTWNGIPVDAADFVSLDRVVGSVDLLKAARQADGSLPDLGGFLHLASGSNLVDAGTPISFLFDGSLYELSYNGLGPDLGAYETAGGAGALVTDSSSGQSAEVVLAATSTSSLLSPEFLAWLEQMGITVDMVNGQYTFSYTWQDNSVAPAVSPSDSTGGQYLSAAALTTDPSPFAERFSTSLEARPTIAAQLTSTTATVSATSQRLHLLDRVLSELAPVADNDPLDDDPLAISSDGDQQDGQATDLALAAVLDDEWWLGV